MAKILLVDDLETSRKLLANRLRRVGFEVILAGDGAKAVTLATAQLPELILMDMRLPVKDGWTATRELRTQTCTSHIPIIALTAYDGDIQQRQCFDAGCNAVEIKPVRFQQLVELINKYLPGKAF